MKAVFFGTPEFALPSLKTLYHSHHTLLGVVTAADKPAGRGRKSATAPVAIAAQQLGLPVLKPVNLRSSDFIATLRTWQADVFVVVAFRILPEEVFTLPRFGAINLHASLLPAYRGAAPIQWALWNGERKTGLTTFRIEKAVDTGNILKQRRVEILDNDDAGSLATRLANIGAELLLETLDELEAGKLVPHAQDNAKATAAPKITREHCRIDWSRSAEEIHNQVRALSPEPGAFMAFKGQIIKVFRTAVAADRESGTAGELIIGEDSITAGTGQGSLQILELQLQGKKRMDVKSFLRGFRLRGRFRLAEA